MHAPSREELEAAGLLDFRNVVRIIWRHLGLPEPTPLQLSICRTLQYGPKRLMIQAFRGVGKSWLTAAFVIFNWLEDPQRKILVVSASQPLADSFSIFVKSLVHSIPEFAYLRPNDDQRKSNLAWDVGPAMSDPAPSMKSAGITGQITGSRADIIIFDDVEVPKNSYTHTMRERLAELVREASAVLKPLPTSRILYLGTPQTEESIYKKLPERGYSIRIWPAQIPENPEKYGANLAPYIVKLMTEKQVRAGLPTEPLRFHLEELSARRAEYGSSGYALQFMLDTSPSDLDAHPLKLRDLIVFSCDREMAPVKLVWGSGKALLREDLPSMGFDGDHFHSPFFMETALERYTGCVMAVDPSGDGKDETAYAVVRILHGQLFLVASGGFLEGFSDATLEAIAKIGAKHGVNYVITERNFGGGMFGQLLKPHLLKHGGGSIDEEYKVVSRGMKEQRIIETLQPVMEQHRLIVDPQVVEQDAKRAAEDPYYSLFWQLTRIRKERGALPHDDRLDALEMAVAYWTDKMARDKELAAKEHYEEKERVEQEAWMAGHWLRNRLGLDDPEPEDFSSRRYTEERT